MDRKQLKSFARVCLALNFLDGDLDPAELASFELVLQDLGISENEAAAIVDEAVTVVNGRATKLDELIQEECTALPKSVHASLFEAAAHMVLADGELTDAECQRLAALRAFLGLSEAAAYAVVASVAHAEPELTCKVSKEVLT